MTFGGFSALLAYIVAVAFFAIATWYQTGAPGKVCVTLGIGTALLSVALAFRHWATGR